LHAATREVSVLFAALKPERERGGLKGGEGTGRGMDATHLVWGPILVLSC